MATSPRLDAAYVAQVKAVRARVESFALARSGAGQHRDADLERFIAQVVPVALAARKQVSSLTDAYLSRVLGAGALSLGIIEGVADAANSGKIGDGKIFVSPL